MTRVRRFAVGVTAVVLLGIALLLGSLRGLSFSRDVPVIRIQREAFQRTITAEGNLKAVRATPVTAPMESEGPFKIAWLAPEGSRVQSGDVVVRFDPTDKEKEVVDGRADREAADRKIAKKKAEDRAALKNLDRDADHAQLELDSARTFQSKDPQIFSRVEIIESEIDQGLAKSKMSHATAERTTRGTLSKTDVDILGIERHKADLKVRQGEKALRSLEIRAPHAGILTYKRDWRGNMPRVGDSIWMGQPVAEIPELDEMEAEVYVLEADAGGVAVGVEAEVVLDAQPGTAYHAKVKMVDKLARPRFRGVPVQYFSLVLSLERTDPAVMKPGLRVRANLTLDARKDALVVPRDAVLEKDGKKVVYRRATTGFAPVEVTLGPTALGRVVVESGLADGDVIALRDPTRSTPDDGSKEAPGKASPPAPAPEA